MPIEGLDSREQLVIVPNIDQHLRVVLHALRIEYDKQRAENSKMSVWEQYITSIDEWLCAQPEQNMAIRYPLLHTRIQRLAK